MKKSVLCILLAFAVLIGSVCLSASARDNGNVAECGYFIYGDYKYNRLDSFTCEIIKYNGSDSEVTVPEDFNGYTVVHIGEEAFYKCGSLETVHIPDTVTEIGAYAFRGCEKLKKATLGKSVTSIDGYAFYGCSALADINFPDSLTSIGSLALSNTAWYESHPYGLVYAGKVLYNDHYSYDEDVVIEPGTKGIAEKAFYNHSSLKSVIIPESVTVIGDWAFDGCTSLENVNIPASVKSIGDGTFWECKSLKHIDIPDSVTSIGTSAFSGCKSLNGVVIPDSVTSIGVYAFSHCESLTELNIPAAVNSIEREAFWGCSSLGTITVDDNNSFYDSRDNCNALIETGTDTLLRGCVNTRIPDTVRVIGSYAFDSIETLTSITIPDSVTSIEKFAFYDCTSLKSVTVPASVTYIGDYAIGYYYGIIYQSKWITEYGIIQLSDFTLKGYNDTEAQRYAQSNKLTFESLGEKPTEPPVLLGDADGSGEVDLVDATVIQRHTTMIAVPYDEAQLMCADIDGDGSLTIVDATFIQRYATKVQTPYKIGEAVD